MIEPEDRIFDDWRDYPYAWASGALPWWVYVALCAAVLVVGLVVS